MGTPGLSVILVATTPYLALPDPEVARAAGRDEIPDSHVS